MSRRISDHIRSNVWAIVVGFLAVMGTAVVANASDEGPQATKSASTAKQVKQLKRKLASVEQRLAALEGKPVPTIPTSLPPSGPAGGELAGAYPSPAIGTVSGLDLASSTSSTAGINFGTDVNLYRAGPTPVLQTDDGLNVLGPQGLLVSTSIFSNSVSTVGPAFFGDTFGDETTLSGYLNTAHLGAAPSATDCNVAAEVGRMVYDGAGNQLYICDPTGPAWRTVATSALP
jgi:hypothetical protein